MSPTGLPRDELGREYGTAEELARLLTTKERPITAAKVRNWAWRSRRPGDKLHGKLPRVWAQGARTGTTWYRLEDAAEVAAATRRDVVLSDATLTL